MASEDWHNTTNLTLLAIIGIPTLIVLILGLLLAWRRRRKPTLRWQPEAGTGWLAPESWRELPDVARWCRRLAPETPPPAYAVPPDPTLRKLWLVRAELAADQNGSRRSMGALFGWGLLVMVGAGGCALSIGMVLTDKTLDSTQRVTLTVLAVFFAIGVLVSVQRFLRDAVRHLWLRWLQSRLAKKNATQLGALNGGKPIRILETFQQVTDPETGATGLYYPGKVR